MKRAVARTVMALAAACAVPVAAAAGNGTGREHGAGPCEAIVSAVCEASEDSLGGLLTILAARDPGRSAPDHRIPAVGEPGPDAPGDPVPAELAAGPRAPGSREELFGLPRADRRPGERAEGPAPEVRLSGIFDSTLAYTFASPTHLSRAVLRGRVSAEGNFGGGVKWKLGVRVDTDPVFYGSDFYLSRVKRDQRFDAFAGENYLDFGAAGWDWRIGAQNIVWGEVVGLFFADVVSPRDLREFLLPGFDLIRLPQWAARAEKFWGDSHLELIWIPIPSFDDIGKPGSDFYPVRLPSPTPAQVAARFDNPERPARTLDHSNYGLRFNTLASGWDLAAFFYRSSSAGPTFFRTLPGAPGQPPVFEPRHDQIWQIGGTVGKDLADLVLRGELIYTDGQRFNLSNPAALPGGVVERSTLDYIASLDIPVGGDSHINVQGFQRVFFGGDGNDLALRTDGFGASILLSTKWGNALEPQVLWLQSFRAAGGLIRPRLNWRIAPDARIGFGVDIFTGPSDGFFGRFGNRDRIYTELRLDF